MVGDLFFYSCKNCLIEVPSPMLPFWPLMTLERSSASSLQFRIAALLSAKRAFLASLWPLSTRRHIVARWRRTATTPLVCPSVIKTHCYLFCFYTL